MVGDKSFQIRLVVHLEADAVVEEAEILHQKWNSSKTKLNARTPNKHLVDHENRTTSNCVGSHQHGSRRGNEELTAGLVPHSHFVINEHLNGSCQACH
jgi:hypothetical protein